MKTKISKILLIFMIIILSIGGVYTSSANGTEESYKLNLKENEAVLQYTTYEVANPYVYYLIDKENGETEEYPAYCLNRYLPGIEKNKDMDYIVSPNGQVTYTPIWTAITNGYPYKSIEEMNCETKYEAYAATLQAIYCILYNFDKDNYSNYSALNESGERVLAALKVIVDKVRYNPQSKNSTRINIYCDDNTWKVDKINEEYVYKEYRAANSASDFSVKLGVGYPEGTLITDLNNQEKSEFKKGEHFKVIMPASKVKQDGSFYIKVDGKVKTLPVYDGSTGNQNLQNYALTHELYEDGHGEILEKFENGKSQVTIIKRDNDTKQRLEAAEFNILDESKKVVYAGIVTDEEGKAEVKNVEPGIYYLEETIAPSGYHKLKEPVRFEVKFNQELTLNVNNTIEKHTESSTITGNITITDKYEENVTNTEHYEENIEINEKNNINNQIMQNNKESNSTLNQTNNIKEENNTRLNNTENIKQEIDNSMENKQKNITAISTSVKNTKELPKTGM